MERLFFRRDGTPYTGEKAALQWAKDFQKQCLKRVGWDELPDGKIVSTVWLGIDHNYGFGEPLIFESMVFENQNNFSELACARYSTEAEALAGHERMVRKWT